jgi:uncharacterized protein (TIGR04222 family)
MPLNPLDFTGPEFLVFFPVYALSIWGAQEWAQRCLEESDAPLPRLTDPYAIGYLRAGAKGALQVAVVSLVQRGLLLVAGDQLVRESQTAPEGINPLEGAVLEAASARQKPLELVRDPRIVGCCLRTIKPQLLNDFLIPDERQKIRRRWIGAGAVALVLGLALVKILVALSRGRTNIGFLIVESALLTLPPLHTMRRVPTQKGTEVLNSLAGLFGHLRRRPDSWLGLEQPELVMLTAVFGTSAAPPAAQEFLRKMSSTPQSGGCGSGCGGGGGGGCGGCGA